MEGDYELIVIKMKKVRILLLMLLIIVTKSYSQGELLYKGSSGVFSSYSYISSDEASGWLGHLGYSYNGIIDLGIGYGKSALDNNTELNYLKWSIVQYSLSVYLNKGELDSNFVSFAISLSYSDITYKSDDVVYHSQGFYVIERTDKGYLITPTFSPYLSFKLGYSAILQFFGSIGISLSNNTLYNKDGILAFGFGFNVGIYLSPAILITTSPAFAVVEGNTSLGINIGLVILTNKL